MTAWLRDLVTRIDDLDPWVARAAVAGVLLVVVLAVSWLAARNVRRIWAAAETEAAEIADRMRDVYDTYTRGGRHRQAELEGPTRRVNAPPAVTGAPVNHLPAKGQAPPADQDATQTRLLNYGVQSVRNAANLSEQSRLIRPDTLQRAHRAIPATTDMVRLAADLDDIHQEIRDRIGDQR